MKKKDAGILACKIISLLSLVRGLQMSSFLVFEIASRLDLGDTTAIPALVWFLVAAVLWFFAEPITTSMLRTSAPDNGRFYLSVFGLYLIAWAFPQTVQYSITLLMAKAQMQGYEYLFSGPRPEGYMLAGQLVIIALGVWLFLGTPGLTRSDAEQHEEL